MKNIAVLMVGLFVAVTAWGACLTPEDAAKQSCVRYSAGDSWCKSNAASATVAYKSTSTCKDAVTSSRSSSSGRSTTTNTGPRPAGLAKVKSGLDEIETLLDMMDTRKKSSFFSYNAPVIVRSFDNSQVAVVLERMTELKSDLLKLSRSTFTMNSKVGKEVVVSAHRYFGMITRVYELYALTAHKNEGPGFSYNNLSNFRMTLDKKVGLELLARMNLKARHIDDTTLEFMVSEEEKQNFEFLAMQKPNDLMSYGKLVQFMSLRELLANKWSLERMSATKIDDPTLYSCGPNMMSFSPVNGKMSQSNAMKELFAYDSYFNDYAPLISKAVASSKDNNILSVSESTQLVDKIMAAVPTIEYTLVNDFGWFDDEVIAWKKEVADSVRKNEATEWDLYAETVLSVAAFPADELRSDLIAARMARDAFKIRSQAIEGQILAILEILPEEDLKDVKNIVRDYLERQRASYEQVVLPKLATAFAALNSTSSLATKKYNDKLTETKDIVRLALPSAWFTDQLVQKRIKKKLFSQPKFKVQDLEPKTPTELLTYLQVKMTMDYEYGNKLSYTIDKDPKSAKLVSDYFKAIQKRFEKLGTKLSVKQYQDNLFKIAAEEAIKLGKKYPMTSRELLDNYNNEYLRQHPTFVADNTRVVRPPILRPVPVNSPDCLNQLKEDVKSPAQTGSSYDVMSMMRMHPAVADNTRVVINNRILDHKVKNTSNCVTKWEIVDPDEYKKLLADKKTFYHYLFRLLNIYNFGTPTSLAGTTGSFLDSLGDQKIIADYRLGDAYNAAPMTKIPLVRYTTEYITMGVDGSYASEVKEEKPAMIRMLSALTVKADGSHVVDETRLISLAKEVLDVAKNNMKGLTETFCKADYTKYKSDKGFKNLFRSATYIRQGLTSNQSLNASEAEKIEKFDEEMRKATRFWHEKISEDYVEPMLLVATVIFIISAFLIPWVGAAGLLSPGTMLLLMTVLDGVDLALTGASLYFRSMANFYEVPAQVRFQKSLASTQIGDFRLTTWDDVDAAVRASEMQQLFTVLFSPLDAIVGGQFYFSARKLIGVTGKNALKRMGLPARGFGQPPKPTLIKRSFQTMWKQHGFTGAVTRKTKDMLINAKKWFPRYQPYTQKELTESVRVGLVTKAKELALDMKPWELTKDIDSMIARMESRLDVSKSFTNEAGDMIEKVRMNGSFSFKEFIAKPSYSKELMIPVSFIKAVKRGNVKEWLSNYDEVLDAINSLRGKYLKDKADKLKSLKDKLLDVQKAGARDPEFLSRSGYSSWMDYYQNLLDDKELKMFQEMTKFSKSESAKGFRKVFKDHEKVMEGLRPLDTVDGRPLGSRFFYPSYFTHTASDLELDFGDDASDLRAFYETILRDEALDDVSDEFTTLRRRIIEDNLYNGSTDVPVTPPVIPPSGGDELPVAI